MSTALQECVSRFGIDGSRNIVEDRHFGIVNGHLTTNVLHSNALSFRSLYAPPYASSNFAFDGWVCGEAVKTTSYSWMPFQVRRRGTVPGVEVSTVITLVEGRRALILEIKLSNGGDSRRRVPLQFDISGGLDYVTDWNFAQPVGDKPVRATVDGDVIVCRNDTGMLAVGARGLTRHGCVPLWETELDLGAGQSESFWLTLAVGEPDHALSSARELLDDPAGAVDRSSEAWAARASELLGRLPRFTASDRRLERFYDRSVLHFLLNRWHVPEFLLNPYYSTGSINGGCVVSYLWDFGEGWEVFSLVDPAAAREHIKAFLAINLTRHFAFNPISGAGWGPWYPVNQEKIVFHIYYYVLQTGDVGFLRDTVKGTSILDWVLEHALVGDRQEERANLIDYGAGNHHLELRRQHRYDHFLPDLNARRYPIYLAAETLLKLAGRKAPVDLRHRAEMLKALIHDEMWSEKDAWWFHLDPEGGRHLRFTMQLFKLIASGAITAEE